MRGTADFKFWAGVAVSAFFMVLLFRKIDYNQLVSALGSVNYAYVAAAVGLTFISYFLRSVRWHFLLITVKPISLCSLYPATIIGYMANNLLPARLGEFVRAYVLAKKEGLETPAVFASLVIDRLFDGFTVLMMLLITLFTLRLPSVMSDAETALRMGGLVTFLLYCVVLLFLYMLRHNTSATLDFATRLMKPLPLTIKAKLLGLLGSFIAGIRISSRWSHIAAILGSSVLVWFFALLPVDMVLQGFGIRLPISASMFILVLLVFAVMVPASPGFIGTYHYACYKGLSAFGISDSLSVSIALIIHAVSFFPVIVAGLYYLWKDGISLGAVSMVRGDR